MFRSFSNPLRRAGACAAEIALSRFINPTVFETKLGDLGMILRLAGIDPDCRTDDAMNAYTRRFESAIRLFDDRFRVYSYIVKRSGVVPSSKDWYPTPEADAAVHRRVNALRARSGSLYEIQLYMAVLYEGFRPRHQFFAAINKAAINIAMQADPRWRSCAVLSDLSRSSSETRSRHT